MYKILFICYGNICRSPMAEFVLKDMLAAKGLDSAIHVESAATSNWEVGNPVDSRTHQRLAREGISCAGKTARQMTRADYDKFDLIIGMDDENIRNIHNICKGDPQGKIYKMMEFAGSDADVADPWFTNDFETTYNDIYAGCVGLMDWLKPRI